MAIFPQNITSEVINFFKELPLWVKVGLGIFVMTLAVAAVFAIVVYALPLIFPSLALGSFTGAFYAASSVISTIIPALTLTANSSVVILTLGRGHNFIFHWRRNYESF